MMSGIDADERTATLLVVDDDLGIRSLLATSLSARGYQIVTASNAAEMRRVLERQTVDVVILDIMMPGEDGLAACRRLAENGGPPVILLSALGEETDRILELEHGADHYLPKPCSAQEILAHVRTVLRRQKKSSERARHLIFFMGFHLDLDTRELFNREGALVDLSDGEFAILRVFIERPRRVLSRNELLLAARGPDSDAFDRAIDVQVSRLRRKLKGGEENLIRTVRNEGYMFVPKVTAAP